LWRGGKKGKREIIIIIIKVFANESKINCKMDKDNRRFKGTTKPREKTARVCLIVFLQ